MSDFKPMVYEWDHARNRYVTPGDRVECLKERVVAADDYVTMKEELRAEVERRKASNEELRIALMEASDKVERLRAALADSGAWLFDDGSSFRLVGIAGGAHKEGICAEVQCEELAADGRLTIHNYKRTNTQEVRAADPTGESR